MVHASFKQIKLAEESTEFSRAKSSAGRFQNLDHRLLSNRQDLD